MEKSSNIEKLMAALAEFQKDVPLIHRDVENTTHKTRYASLENIVNSIRPVLSKHQLVVTQWPEEKNTLTTLLCHYPSGQYLQASHHLTPEENTPTAIGAALTHQRRYGLAAILCLNLTDEPLNQKLRVVPEVDVPPAKIRQAAAPSSEEKKDDGSRHLPNGTIAIYPDVPTDILKPSPWYEPSPESTDERPWLNKKTFSKALERIEKGEISVAYLTVNAFQMKRELADALYNAAKKSYHDFTKKNKPA